MLVRSSIVSAGEAAPAASVGGGRREDERRRAPGRERAPARRERGAGEAARAPAAGAGRLGRARGVGDRGGEADEHRVGLRGEVRGRQPPRGSAAPTRSRSGRCRPRAWRRSAPRRSPASGRPATFVHPKRGVVLPGRVRERVEVAARNARAPVAVLGARGAERELVLEVLVQRGRAGRAASRRRPRTCGRRRTAPATSRSSSRREVGPEAARPRTSPGGAPGRARARSCPARSRS